MTVSDLIDALLDLEQPHDVEVNMMDGGIEVMISQVGVRVGVAQGTRVVIW